jgi:hypothetical protein
MDSSIKPINTITFGFYHFLYFYNTLLSTISKKIKKRMEIIGLNYFLKSVSDFQSFQFYSNTSDLSSMHISMANTIKSLILCTYSYVPSPIPSFYSL